MSWCRKKSLISRCRSQFSSFWKEHHNWSSPTVSPILERLTRFLVSTERAFELLIYFAWWWDIQTYDLHTFRIIRIIENIWNNIIAAYQNLSLSPGPRHSPGILPRALDRIFSALGPHVSKDSRFRPERYEEVKQLDTEARTEARERRENYLAKKSATAAMKMPENHPLIQISSQGTEGSQSTGNVSGYPMWKLETVSFIVAVDSHGFFDFRPTTESEAMVIQDRDFVDKEATYEVWVSFLEIYEDVAYDLLDLSGSSKATGRVLRSGTLRVMEKGNTCYAQGNVSMSNTVY